MVNGVKMKYCMRCGKKMRDDDAFCAHCGFGRAANIDPFGYDAPTENAEDEDEKQTTNISGIGVTALDESTEEYEPAEQPLIERRSVPQHKTTAQLVKGAMTGNKRGLLHNILVLICSVVMLFVALFAPVKVADYTLVFGETSLSIDHVSDGKLKASFAEIEQSVFQVLGAFEYINPTDKQVRALENQITNAKEAAALDLGMWIYTHPNANEYEVAKKQSEIYNKHMSDVNYFAYCMIMTSGENMQAMRAKILVFLGVTTVVALLSLAIAIISLVYLILCIVGLARHKPDINVSKFLKIMFGCCGASVLTCMMSPVTMSSGVGFGLLVFVAVCMILWGTLSELCDGQNRLRVLKRAGISVLALTAFILLCCNCIKLTVDYGYNYVISCKPGIGFGASVISLPDVTGSVLTLAILYVLLAVGGGIAAFLALLFALLECGSNGKKSVKTGVCAVISAWFTIAAIAIGFSSGVIITAFDNILDATSSSSAVAQSKLSVTGVVWAAAVLSILTAVIAFVFNPKDKQPQTDGGTEQPVDGSVENGQTVDCEQPAHDEPSADSAQSADEVQSAETTENI